MQDEHFIRQWNDVHEDFTADLQQTLNQIGRYRRSRVDDDRSIRLAYGTRATVHPQPELSPAAQASLRGLAATIVTFGLWITVMALATPTPGLV